MSEQLKTLLEACISQQHFKTLFKEHSELVRSSPSLVFLRLEAAYHVNQDQDFYTSLSSEVLKLLESFPISVPVKVDYTSPPETAPRPMSEVEREHILYAVRYCDYDTKKAALALGLSDRTVRTKLDQYIGNRTHDSNGTLKLRMLQFLSSTEGPSQ